MTAWYRGSSGNALDYLETLVNYLMSSAGNLEEKEIGVPVSEVFNEGGEIMATIAEKLTKKAKLEVVMNMLREGLSADIISRTSGFTVAQINEYKEKMQEQQVNAAA
jgi:predicted transposase YdaD